MDSKHYGRARTTSNSKWVAIGLIATIALCALVGVVGTNNESPDKNKHVELIQKLVKRDGLYSNRRLSCTEISENVLARYKKYLASCRKINRVGGRAACKRSLNKLYAFPTKFKFTPMSIRSPPHQKMMVRNANEMINKLISNNKWTTPHIVVDDFKCVGNTLSADYYGSGKALANGHYKTFGGHFRVQAILVGNLYKIKTYTEIAKLGKRLNAKERCDQTAAELSQKLIDYRHACAQQNRKHGSWNKCWRKMMSLIAFPFLVEMQVGPGRKEVSMTFHNLNAFKHFLKRIPLNGKDAQSIVVKSHHCYGTMFSGKYVVTERVEQNGGRYKKTKTTATLTAKKEGDVYKVVVLRVAMSYPRGSISSDEEDGF